VTACGNCGSSVRLRYDRDRSEWRCVSACTIAHTAPMCTLVPRPKRQPLFEGFIRVDGIRRRATRAELVEANRLWAVHADIREGTVGA
jgi:hypothetical protein